MKLNDSEKQMVRWLRSQHEYWKSNRAIITVSSIISILVAAWGAYNGESGFAIFPWLGFGFYGLSYCLGCWSGRPEISLLLKLTEEAMKQSPGQEADS